MKKIQKLTNKAFLLSCILAATSVAFAADVGGTLGNSTKIKKSQTSDYVLNQKNNATLWVTIPTNDVGTSYLSIQGSATHKYDDTDMEHFGDKKTTTDIFDIDLFKYNYYHKQSASDSVVFALGRFSMSDNTGIIFSQPCDGILFQKNAVRYQLMMYGGYTGWLNAQNVTILNAEDSKFSYDAEKAYDYASPYFVGGISLSLPYLFLNQTLGLEGYAFSGANGENGDNSGYDRYYGTIVLNGPLSKNLFYVASTTIGTEDAPDIGNLSQLHLTYFPNFYNATIGASAEYASGKQGPFKPFKGFTSNTATYSSVEPEYSGLLKSGISASIKPVSTVLLSGGSDVIFLCPDDTFKYNGIQFYGNVLYQMCTDLKLTGFVAHFIGDDDTLNLTQVTLRAVVSF